MDGNIPGSPTFSELYRPINNRAGFIFLLNHDGRVHRTDVADFSDWTFPFPSLFTVNYFFVVYDQLSFNERNQLIGLVSNRSNWRLPLIHELHKKS